jgi:acetylornithine deacetylase
LKSYFKILEKLISFDTTSSKSNVEAINYIEKLFKDKKKYKIIKVYNSIKNKCSLLIKPYGDISKGILFAGHIDTVSVDGQKWSASPFKLVNKNGKLFGRGVVDMKGFLSLIIANMLNDNSSKLPFCLSVTHDEETGCEGIYNLSKYIQKKNILLPDKCIVGEPTKTKIVTANKGAAVIETIVKCKKDQGHSSNYNQKVNTITLSSELIIFLQSLQNKISKKNILKCTPNNSSIHIGLCNGGTGHNIIPKQTSFKWEIRYINDDLQFVKKNFEKFQKLLLKKYKEDIAEITIENIPICVVPGLIEKNQKKIITLMNKFNIFENEHVPFGTEAGIIQKLGLSTIIFGPGSISQAHKPDEFITINQLEKYDQLLNNILNF